MSPLVQGNSNVHLCLLSKTQEPNVFLTLERLVKFSVLSDLDRCLATLTQELYFPSHATDCSDTNECFVFECFVFAHVVICGYLSVDLNAVFSF